MDDREKTTSFAQNLSPEDLDYLKQIARKTCARVASASRMDAGAAIRWEPLGCKDGVDLYFGAIPDERVRSKARKYMCGVTYIMASIDEVVQLFHSKSSLQRVKDSEPQTRFNAFERDILNTRTLHKIRKRTSANPRHAISLKWMRLGSSAANMEDRDFVYLECQDTIFDEKLQRRGWVCSMHSVHLPSCPVLDGYVRGSLYRSGYVVRETSTPGTLELVCIMDMDFKGTLSEPATNLWLKARVLTVSGVRQHFESQWNTSQLPPVVHAPPKVVPEEEPEAASAATHCVSCHDEFNGYNPSTTCVHCQQAVCRTCSCEIDETSEVWCTSCLIQAKQAQRFANDQVPEEVDVPEEDEIVHEALGSPQHEHAPALDTDEDHEDDLRTRNQVEEDVADCDASIASATSEGHVSGVVQPAGFFARAWTADVDDATWHPDDEAAQIQSHIAALSDLPAPSSAMAALALRRLMRAKTFDEQKTRLAIVNVYHATAVN
ncbi:hypothetical protein SDRG_04891 [Saprolegnia diclina VS20]|uniref:START domain-containing protein n=1 Tax=Saprolegnia diclina (strain VS20) TaxID=1156394 RepID=T0QV11_SAPDV|nr:hypothetical protein SDRG_04891 [Saprolegnia diclina VS20]EQC37870.1 hypothetical protein SDRG_04891 [Saprolegnia diclina VS20]|eukprot:XP_008608803.1 hypothetical protein SDRG_04891 [Saprolegnia diclina VS20]